MIVCLSTSKVNCLSRIINPCSFKHFNIHLKFKSNTFKLLSQYYNIINRKFISHIDIKEMSKTISYVTDIEGNHQYWSNYINISKVVDRVPTQITRVHRPVTVPTTLSETNEMDMNRYSDDNVNNNNNNETEILHHLVLKPNSMLVYGGDVCDRYEGDFRVISDLLQLKYEHMDNVVLIQGNRDVNKLRLVPELLAIPPLSLLVENYLDIYIQNAREELLMREILESNPNPHIGCKDNNLVYWIRTPPPTPDPEPDSGFVGTDRVSFLKDLDITQSDLDSVSNIIDNMIKHWQVDKLKWILEKTMGAPVAFEMRRRELTVLGYLGSNKNTQVNNENSGIGMGITGLDEDYVVVQSYIDSMLPPATPIHGYVETNITESNSSISSSTNPDTNTSNTRSNRVVTEIMPKNRLRVTYAYQKYTNFWNDSYIHFPSEHKTRLPIGGLLCSYLIQGQIAFEPTPISLHNRDHVLFVHGAISTTNIGWLPPTCESLIPYEGASQLTSWCHSMNVFSAKEIQDYIENIEAYVNTTNQKNGYLICVRHDGEDGQSGTDGLGRIILCNNECIPKGSGCGASNVDKLWATVGGYDHSHPSSRLMQYGMGWMPDKSVNPTVIYANYLNNGKPISLPCEISNKLAMISGADALTVDRSVDICVANTVITGHQPHGDAPLLIQSQSQSQCPGGDKNSVEPATELTVGSRILACDTSYSVNTQWHPDTTLFTTGDGGSSEGGSSEGVNTIAVDPLNSRGHTVSEVLVYTAVNTNTSADTSTSTHRIVLHGRLSTGYYYHSIIESLHSRDASPIGRPIADDWWVKLPINYYHPTIKSNPEYAPTTPATADLSFTHYTHYLLVKSVGYSVLNRVVTRQEFENLIENKYENVDVDLQ